jgi:hypothetical protein
MWLYNSLLVFIGLAKIIYENNQHEEMYNSTYIKKSKMLTINAKKLYLVIVFFPLLILSALRSVNIGNDTDTYHHIFNISTYTNFKDFLEMNVHRWEKGFLVFTKLISSISDNPQLLIAISSIISLFFVGRFIYLYSKKPSLSVFLFVTMRFYFFFMSNIRQSIALGLVLFGYDFIKKKRIIPFSIVILIAAQFHSTAIIFFFAYFIDNIKYSNKYFLGSVLITVLIFIGFDSFMRILLTVAPDRYLNYVNTSYYTDATNVANIANFATTLAVLFLSYMLRYYKNNDKSEISFYYLLISVCIGLLSIKFGMFSRIQHYFYIFSIVLIPNMMSKLNNKHTKLIVSFIIVICFFLYHIIILALRPEWQNVYPYEFFFSL